jgi:tRNA pseudouridine55 synthase
MDGVLVVDKPQGLTSHDVVAMARRYLREPRIGHTGTLDPLATGVLPLACGRATRLVRFLSSSEKDYDAVIRFGVTTDSYDVTGTEVARSERVPTRAAVEAVLQSLLGDHVQVPPAFSAKRVAGQRAYRMARRAQPVALQPVTVRLTRADLVEFTGASARVALSCSAGFYVRAFAHVLGERVGTGACLEALRRTRSGPFDLSDAVTIEELQRNPAGTADRAVPLDRLLLDLPGARLTDEGRTRVSHGQDVDRAHVWPEDSAFLEARSAQWVRLLDAGGRLLALARVADSAAPSGDAAVDTAAPSGDAAVDTAAPSGDAAVDTGTPARRPPALHPAVVLF